MPDQIIVTGIRGIGHHGVFDFERQKGQEFVVDVVLDVDTARAASSDDLADTVNYADVANGVHALIVGEPVDLIETLAERVADSCLAHPGARRVLVTVHKPQAPIEVSFDDVMIRIERERPHG